MVRIHVGQPLSLLNKDDFEIFETGRLLKPSSSPSNVKQGLVNCLDAQRPELQAEIQATQIFPLQKVAAVRFIRRPAAF